MSEHRAQGRTRHGTQAVGAVDDAAGEASGRPRTAEERVRAARRRQPAPEVTGAASLSPVGGRGDHETSEGAVGAGTAPTDEQSAAQGDGLVLVERLAERGGTRTWLAREQTTREGFTVTFAVAEDPGQRRPVEDAFAALVDSWARETHPSLVGVRAVLASGAGPRDGNGSAEVLGGGAGNHEDGVLRGALVAEHVKARPLAEIMREKGRVAPEALLPVLADAARGLARLHERGWVHGTLSAQHVLVRADGSAALDGYGVRAGSTAGPPAWGQARDGDVHHRDTRQWDAGRPVSRMQTGDAAGAGDCSDEHRAESASPAQDVYELAVTGWLALTGRHPGPDSHRVPLSLMCPSAPRHLVLMLEAGLCDDPAQRPSAHELAVGFDTPVRRPVPARRPPERMTPEVIRADGTVVRARRRPLLGAGLRWGSGPGEHRDRPRTGGAVRGGASALAGESRGRRRVLVLAAAALAAAALAWGAAGWTGGNLVAGTGPAAPTASPGDEHDAAGGAASTTGEAAGDPSPNSSGNSAPGSGGTARGAAPSPTAEATERPRAAGAPGESMQDKDREAREAVGELVARRAAALAAGDESAAEQVYVPRSGLAARDRDLIRRAAAQDGAGTGPTALSGVSMEVVSLTEQRTDPGTNRSPAEAARTRTYDAQVLTRGWTGALPTGSAVTPDGDGARQHLRITVTRTAQGWRLADVTPVAAG